MRLEDYQQKLDNANEQLATTHNELEKLKKISSNSLSSRLSLKSIKNEYPIITPEKYELIKYVQYRKLKWVLFRNKIQYKEDYLHFIWSPIRNEKDFEDFGNFYQMNNSSDLQQQIEELKDYQAELIEQLAKKESDYNKLNLNFAKLFNKKKTGDFNQDKLIETIDKLTRENKKLHTTLKSMKQGDNFFGISFIEDDLNGSQFIDDCGLEEILDNLVKNDNFSNGKNIKKTYIITNQLKNSVDSLLGLNNLNQNAKFILASIFKQLSLNDEDIHYLLGKSRGVISLSPSLKV